MNIARSTDAFWTLSRSSKRLLKSKNGVLREFDVLRYASSRLKRNQINLHEMPGLYDAVIIGGGTAGMNLAHRFKSALHDLGHAGDRRHVALIDHSTFHYYQPIWTLVGAGAKKFESSFMNMQDLVPTNIYHIADRVNEIDPANNSIRTAKKGWLFYKQLFVCTGMELDIDRIKGLQQAFETPFVVSNYSPETVKKTWIAMQDIQKGNAIFTFPNSPVKCPGAPQKIMYLADHYWRKQKRRNNINIQFNSALAGIFSVQKYAKELNAICEKRNLTRNFRHDLIEIDPVSRAATFENLDTHEKTIFNYDFMHVTPPQRPPSVLKPIADANGFVDVDPGTLQHKQYKNIWALGDCANLPTSKTAAAAAAQTKVVFYNAMNALNNFPLPYKYDGYTSCPLVTGYGKCILAEFDYKLEPKETFPINQAKERLSMYILKKNLMPWLYWFFHVKGKWSGPGLMRKIFRLGFSN
ncbi:sulfide quinone oxidoreductase [Brevipalpus obovatus]|uniref:sulfide quinone oxidoreductase n=1 Tax=Brevipalpus obovatus TaxID=246614 RepID=UPI003D9ED4BB